MLINITLRQLQSFVTVALNESYTKASRVIGLSQPAITANVRQLETLLRVRLLDRTTRSVRLTNEGRGFFSVAERLLGELDSAVAGIRALNDMQHGRLVVACLPSVAVRLVGPLMGRFALRYPGITIKLYDGDALDVAERVRSREADLGITSYSQEYSEIDYVPLLRDRLCVACTKDHPLAKSRSIRLKDLERYPFVVLGPTSGTRQVLDEALVKAGVRLNIVCETKQISTVTGMVKAGIGISIVPEVCIPSTGPTGLAAKLLSAPRIERDIGVLTSRAHTLSPAAARFREEVVKEIPRYWKDFATQFY
jgi:LysR family transcriptional regulator, carnitine catabolism transcriptional activator